MAPEKKYVSKQKPVSTEIEPEKQYVSRQGRDDGKRTVMMIGVLLVLIVVMGGALLMVITAKKGVGEPQIPLNLTNQTPAPPKPPQNNTTVTPPCDDQCLLEKAIVDKNLSACAAFADKAIMEGCYEGLSGSSLAACKLVNSTSKKKKCITAFAVSGANISLCGLLTSGADDCRLAVDPCYNSTQKDLCRALESKDPSKCNGNYTCLMNYSSERNDDEGCKLITDRVFETACIAAVSDPEICYDLPLKAERDYCLQLYATYANDYSACREITPDSLYAVDCYSVFAARRGDLSICDADGLGLDSLWHCYTNYSLMSGDLEGCSKIHDLASTNKFKCSFEYAKKYGDPSACNLIDVMSSRKTCYEGAILYSNKNLNWTNCEAIINFEWRNKCYTEAAKLNSDESLCDYITADFAKTSCQDAYALNKSK